MLRHRVTMKQIYNPQHFDKLLERVSGCVARTPKSAVDYLGKNVVAYLDKKIKESAGQEKKLFEKSHNLVASYVDGLKGGDITVKELKQLRADLQEARTAHELAAAEKAERDAKRAQEQGGRKPGEEVELLNEDLLKELKHYDGIDGDAVNVYKKYAKYKKEMPRSIRGKPYLAVRMPIVVIVKGIPDIFKMRRTGLCDDMLFGYPILKNQVLVGMSNDWLRDNYSQKTKTSIRQDGEKNVKFDFEAAGRRIADDIKKRTGRSYIMMEGIHGFDSPDLHWAWFASSQELTRLNGTTGTSTFSVNEWTLPFEQQLRKLRPRKS